MTQEHKELIRKFCKLKHLDARLKYYSPINKKRSMNKICTSIEQSKKLMELGIDINTADMYWLNANYDEYLECLTPFVCGDDTLDLSLDIPAWSLSALLGLISPGNILLRDALNGKYKCINMVDSSYYDNPLDAAFEMVCWLKENGKL